MRVSSYLPTVLATRAEFDGLLADGIEVGSQEQAPLVPQHQSTLKEGEVYSGYVSNLVPEGKYGFIRTKGSETVFFHQSALPHIAAFAGLRLGQEMRFVAREDNKGRIRATNIALITAEKGGEHRGTVRRYGANGQSFGFIFGDDGNEYFFHRNNLLDRREADRLIPGTRVCFVLGSNQKGVIADAVAICPL